MGDLNGKMPEALASEIPVSYRRILEKWRVLAASLTGVPLRLVRVSGRLRVPTRGGRTNG